MVLRVLLLIVFIIGVVQADAQKKPPSKSNKTVITKKPEIPPEPIVEGSDKFIPPPPPPPPPSPTLDFDTTATPTDAKTEKIITLLELTKAMQADVEAAEKSLNETAKNYGDLPVMQEFKIKFLEDIRTGRMSRWLKNLYIREYHKIFTIEELDASIAFYSTPTGQALLKKQQLLISNVLTQSHKIGAYIGQTIMLEIGEQQKN